MVEEGLMRLLSYRGPLPAVVAARWCIDCRRKPHKRPYKGKDQTMTIDYTVTNIQEIRDLIAHHGDLGTPLDELTEGLYHTTATLIVRVDTHEGLIDFHAETLEQARRLYQALV
jgi:hypothetical protein